VVAVVVLVTVTSKPEVGLSGRGLALLVLGQATVKTHVNRIFSKTGAQSRAQAVRYAISNGLAGPGHGPKG
jgi:hypothetical protein